MGFQPKLARQADGLETGFRPPVRFLAGAVQFAMVCPAQRDREFVADLLSQSARLRKTQVVRVTGLAAADEAGLFRDEPQMLLVPQPFGFGEGEHAFVDAGADLVLCRGRVQFGWLVVALIRCRLDLGELGLKCLSDLVSICRSQGICLRPRAQGPGIEIVLGFQPCDLGQQLVPQDCRGLTRQDGRPVTALTEPLERFCRRGRQPTIRTGLRCRRAGLRAWLDRLNGEVGRIEIVLAGDSRPA